MISSFILIALTVLESMLVTRWQRNDEVRASKIDRISRWAFPLAYTVVIASLALTFLV